LPESPVLSLRGVSVAFGTVAVLWDVDLDVDEAGAVGLVGPNGAGKTTLLNVASGFVHPRSGRVVLDGQDVTHLPPPKRARLGLGRTFQTPILFDGLTLAQNLHTAGRMRRVGRNGGVTNDEALEITGLRHVARRRVELLTNYERRLAEIARALMLAPRVLMLDEPATGLRESEVEELSALLNETRQRLRLALVIVSHDMLMVRTCCPTMVVLDAGTVIASGSPEDVLRQAAVIDAYLGSADHHATISAST
jgi:branched-chain amino acid transport system ATP-binding protein